MLPIFIDAIFATDAARDADQIRVGVLTASRQPRTRLYLTYHGLNGNLAGARMNKPPVTFASIICYQKTFAARDRDKADAGGVYGANRQAGSAGTAATMKHLLTALRGLAWLPSWRERRPTER